jgi:hypothetical protein
MKGGGAGSENKSAVRAPKTIPITAISGNSKLNIGSNNVMEVLSTTSSKQQFESAM